MCMIVHRPLNDRGKGSNIPNSVIDTAVVRHPDGFGVAWRDKDGLRHEKFGPDDRIEFRKYLKAVDKRRDLEYVAHFRLATHGPETEALAHPFTYTDPIEGEVLVFHNGIIDIKTTVQESDTQVFVRDVLAHLPSGWWRMPPIVSLVDMAIGWSKIVLMTAAETVNLHEAAGTKDGGLWYSSNHRPLGIGITYSSKYTPGEAYSQYGRSVTKTEDDWDREFEADWERTTGGAWVRRTEQANGKGTAMVPYVSNTPTLHVAGGLTTQPMGNVALWQHEGHTITPLRSFDFTKDGDHENSVVCDSCGTAGDVYLIGGKAYIDINHAWTDDQTFAEDGEIVLSDAEEAEYTRLMDEALLPPVEA